LKKIIMHLFQYGTRAVLALSAILYVVATPVQYRSSDVSGTTLTGK
jgi:hypothetical protein